MDIRSCHLCRIVLRCLLRETYEIYCARASSNCKITKKERKTERERERERERESERKKRGQRRIRAEYKFATVQLTYSPSVHNTFIRRTEYVASRRSGGQFLYNRSKMKQDVQSMRKICRDWINEDLAFRRLLRGRASTRLRSKA
jgi:hypothetical protein